ncbi:alpha-L-fucosidase [Streptomyces radicis]|uniref:alpha-L-fucosidase n=1 Tax=Streptomyces radicis TaxID=1750517 RepID=A0A3A9W7I5_9ACTN|nr:alpha-L-fucosidase [Streptomyces radicis]RKN03476.1 alpha-L-fucosidase [Streptomyces radicis]RKN13338.1 alpha-L-fucosidase [Streptomyces radicis]
MGGPHFNRRTFLTSLSVAGGATIAGLPAVARADPARDAVAGQDSYSETWESVNQHPPAPEWFQDAKFGIYFHWGVFSVPAFGNEWYGRFMYGEGTSENLHHRNVYGDPSEWPYHNFIDGARNQAGDWRQFAPRLSSVGGAFDPDEWAQLFVDAGATFAGPVAEHHDGYSMWDSAVNEWNSVAKGPHLDLLRLHADAIRGRGLKLLVAMHHAYNYTGFYSHVSPQSDPSLRKLYGQLDSEAGNQLWYDKLREVVDGYQPDIIWQDFNLNRVEEARRLAFLAHYYNRAVAGDREVVATYKDGFNRLGQLYDYERGGPADLEIPYWLTDDSISSSSWCYTVGIGYYSLEQMLHSLIDRVSKNGNMLLNIAPMADGTIPSGQRAILLAMGDYLRRFGESIYATRAWSVYGEGPTKMGGDAFTTPRAGTAEDIRFTRDKAGTVLYATVLGWPGGTLNIATPASVRINLRSLRSLQLLDSIAGTYVDLPARTQDRGGLRITMPSDEAPFSAPAYVVKLTFSGPIPHPRTSTDSPLPVSVYRDVDYAGGASLGVGAYTAEQLRVLGIDLRSISSLRVAAGYQVTGFANENFTGREWTFTADRGNLRGTGGNDAIASVRVRFNPVAYVRITNVTNDLVLDGGDDAAAGSSPTQSTWDGGARRQWRIVDLGTGYHRIENRANGLVIDGGGRTDSGALAQQTPWNGATTQQWQITDHAGGRYHITNRAIGLVLDSGGHVPPGSPLKQWPAETSPNLQWTVTAA